MPESFSMQCALTSYTCITVHSLHTSTSTSFWNNVSILHTLTPTHTPQNTKIHHKYAVCVATCCERVRIALLSRRGNFATFEKTLEERMENQQKAAASVAAKKAHMQAFVDKFRYNAKRASLVQSRLKAIEKLEDVEVLEADPDYQFLFPNPGENIGTPILGFSDVSFGYKNGPSLFYDLNFGLDLESRAAVVGPNGMGTWVVCVKRRVWHSTVWARPTTGVGKTTLLHLLSGQLQPTQGVIARNPKLRLAIFSQHHVDNLDLSLTPLRYMCKCFPQAKEQALRCGRAFLCAFMQSREMTTGRIWGRLG